MLKRTTISYKTTPLSLNWRGDELVDWVEGGSLYSLDGTYKSSTRLYSYKFDSAIQSDDGVYSIIYEKLGTKALLLKNGEIIRELNRSFYHASAYEYPVAFLKLSSEQQAIVHCPNEYNKIEIEDAESGEQLTSVHREPADCFHSRFRVSPSNTFLLNTGWAWHPYGIIELYNIQEGIKDNSIFDKCTTGFPTNSEVCSAEFLTDDLMVVSSTKEEPWDDEEMNNMLELHPGQLGLYSISQGKFVKKITLNSESGTLIPLNEDFALDLYLYPKVIDLNTGAIKQRFEEIDSGKQDSSIIHHLDKIPPLAVDTKNRRVAIGKQNGIELLELVD